MHKEFGALKKILKDELKKITDKGAVTPTELDNVAKVVCVLKDMEEYLDKYEMPEEDEYSERGYSRRMPSYYDVDGRFSYDNGYSYDGRGYSRSYRNSYAGGGNGGRMGRYSRNSDKDYQIELLESMLPEINDEASRRTIRDHIDRLERG